jgi:hypothetical protein
MPGVFPDCASNPNSGAERELVLMRWGMRVNNVRQSGQFKTDKTEGRSIEGFYDRVFGKAARRTAQKR